MHRVIPWDEVSLDEGTGIVHIAPGAAPRTSSSRASTICLSLRRSTRRANAPWLRRARGEDHRRGRRAGDRVAARARPLVEATSIVHRYPVCWRCRTPLVFRVVDDWFISADEIRQPMLDGNATVEWTPPQYKKRMDDWLRNMGDWNISRRRFFGLPLPFYECECGELNVIGSRAELEERAVSGLDQLGSSIARGSTPSASAARRCDAEVERIPEVGDAWLDAGIVHFSTLGWHNPNGSRTDTRRGRPPAFRAPTSPTRRTGRSGSRPTGSRNAGADPALVLLPVLHGDRARSPAAVPACPDLRERLRRVRSRDAQVVGQRDRPRRCARADGSRRDALGLLLPDPAPAASFRLRHGGRGQASFSHFLELRQVLRRLRKRPGLPAGLVGAPARRRAVPLDRWLVERTRAFVHAVEAGYEATRPSR